MKSKVVFILVGALLLLVIVAAGLFLLQQSQASQPGKFTLVKETGAVAYKAQATDDYVNMAEAEVELASGGFIKTAADSYARVFLPDNSLISLDQNTEVQITIQQANVSIDQLLGNTWNRVQTVLEGNEYKVETPNTIAAVRGTIFGLNLFQEGETSTFVIDSNVNVSSHTGVSVQETVNVLVDEMATVFEQEASLHITKEQIPDEFKQSYWFQRNLIIDNIWQQMPGKQNKLLRKVFQELVLQKLQATDDYEIYRFGLTPPADTTSQDINSQLQQVQDITKITDQTCVNYSSSDFQLALDKVDVYQDYITNYQEIAALLENLKEACSDGQLSIAETENLQEVVVEINENI